MTARSQVDNTFNRPSGLRKGHFSLNLSAPSGVAEILHFCFENAAS